jgi:outer membrane immunogenic protein
VVQKREVDRDMRLELGINYGMIATGGDPFINTSSLGGQMDFHLTPHWSVGGRYYNYSNSYSTEGRAMNDYSAANPTATRPSVSYPKDSYLAVINWYPIYGKLNFFDSSVVQFDIYALAGGGMMDYSTGNAGAITASGNSPIYTAGGGIGVWLTQHLATRLECRWQGYQDRVFDGAQYDTRSQNEMVLTLGISFLL